jgi:hypothetical protein
MGVSVNLPAIKNLPAETFLVQSSVLPALLSAFKQSGRALLLVQLPRENLAISSHLEVASMELTSIQS